jgi:head-tail adaptor
MRSYDRVLTLERFAAVQNKGGDLVDGWVALKADVPARRRLAPGTERLVNEQNAATAPVVFYVPWAPQYADLNPKDRVLHEGRALDIISAIEVGRHKEIEIATVWDAGA